MWVWGGDRSAATVLEAGSHRSWRSGEESHVVPTG